MKVVLDFIHLRKCCTMLCQLNQLRFIQNYPHANNAVEVRPSLFIGVNIKSLIFKKQESRRAYDTAISAVAIRLNYIHLSCNEILAIHMCITFNALEKYPATQRPIWSGVPILRGWGGGGGHRVCHQ